MSGERVWGRSAVMITLLGIAVNLLGSRLAAFCGWPVFLDTVGTVLTACLGGILPGIIVGFVSNAIISFSDPISLYYGLLNMMIAAIAYVLAHWGAFHRLRTALLCIIPFSIIGGGLGSLMTWMLYGFDFGTGISAPLAIRLNESLHMTKFYAQFVADLGIDVFDKLITVLVVFLLLRYSPQRWLDATPLGALFGRANVGQAGWRDSLKHRGSLRNKVAVLIVITAAVLTIVAVAISSIIHTNTLNERYIASGQDACNLVIKAIDGDRVNDFLRYGEQAADYTETEGLLYAIKDAMTSIQYLYVYQIREDGCHVVFDLDTEDLPGGEPGEIIGFEESFIPLLPDLLAGRPIEPIISNDFYGWLLTIYTPIHDSSGQCVAYAAVDISMADVVADRYIFAIRIISLMFGASIIIIAIAIYYAQKRVVEPINSLASASQRYAFDSEQSRQHYVEQIQNLNIHTGDEIENLYEAIAKTVSDMSGYIDQIAASNEFISRLQDNIILSFAEMVENRDENTGSHIKRTAGYVEIVGRELLRQGRFSEELDEVQLADYIKSAPLHDIGKIKIPDSILNKAGRLTDEEFAVIKNHTTEGRVILQSALKGIESGTYLSQALDMATYHHERWDGNGYPEGLKGEAIPLPARLMAIADVFDALTSKRSYKGPYSFERSVEIIREESGTHFDPVIVEAFLCCLPEIRKLSES